MKIIYNRFLPFRGFAAINLCGVVFARRECRPLSAATLNHEAIHTAQMRELLYVGFYIFYLAEWLVRLCANGNAYRAVSFEREAYRHQHNRNYLRTRKRWAMWR